jgi:hypothetical protein
VRTFVTQVGRQRRTVPLAAEIRALRLQGRGHTARADGTRGHARATVTTAAPAAATTGFGIATANGYPTDAKFASCTVNAVPCPSGDLVGYYINGFNNFTRLKTNLPLGYARFFIPYDALWAWNGSGCTNSPAEPGLGYTDYEQLVWNIQAAQAIGLTPVVAFTAGTGTAVPNNSVPSIPDPGYGNSTSNPWTTWTAAGYDYFCGTLGIMSNIAGAGLGTNPVLDWEAWNEPNGAIQSKSNGGGYNGSLGPTTGYASGPCGTATVNGITNDCGGTIVSPSTTGQYYLCYKSTYSGCGPLEAADLWELAQSAYQEYLSTKGFQVAALTLSNAENAGYEDSYITEIGHMNGCSAGYFCPTSSYSGIWFPTVFAVHDYNDPSSAVAGAHADISSFTSNLYSHYSQNNYTVWITEAATDLNATAPSDGNRASGCNDGEADHQSGSLWTFGGCVDHNPSAQTTGANSFLGLGNYGNGWSITQVDWYEFQPANPSTGFDSGMLAPPQETGGYVSPDGVYGSDNSASGMRQSYCVLARIAASNCSSAAVDGGDWSTNPGGGTGA